jgi:SAM-dependent methyltransferase
VVALDLAPAMLDAASRRLRSELGDAAVERVRWVEGTIATLPSLLPHDVDPPDVAVSSFVLQLVPDRPAALRAIRATLRPGGHLAYVTWMEDDATFAPADAFDDAVVDTAIDEPLEPPDGRAGPPASPAAASGQLRRAGFRQVGAVDAVLEHRWDAASYLALKLEYEEEPLIRALDPSDRARLEDAARRRLGLLPPDAFRWQAPIVYAWGDRPA